jgi:hypothetical protein
MFGNNGCEISTKAYLNLGAAAAIHSGQAKVTVSLFGFPNDRWSAFSNETTFAAIVSGGQTQF